MDNKTFKCREDIPLQDRWATEDLYASDELWEQELGRMVEQGKVMAGYAGTLGRDAATLLDYMKKLEDIQVLSSQLSGYAQRKGAIANPQRNLILHSVHPSPLSSYRGFFGCKHFSKANNYLKSIGKEPIVW